jgi:arsenate reductase-like glutaredoxin family protein
MQISSNNSAIKDLYTQKLSDDEVKQIKKEIKDNANKYTFTDFSKTDFSTKELSVGEQILKKSEDFQKFLYDNGIDGGSVKRISQLDFSTPSYLDIKG